MKIKMKIERTVNKIDWFAMIRAFAFLILLFIYVFTNHVPDKLMIVMTAVFVITLIKNFKEPD